MTINDREMREHRLRAFWQTVSAEGERTLSRLSWRRRLAVWLWGRDR